VELVSHFCGYGFSRTQPAVLRPAEQGGSPGEKIGYGHSHFKLYGISHLSGDQVVAAQTTGGFRLCSR
jgi:hypothetical protein